MKEHYPSSNIYVGSKAIQTEMVNLMRVFGFYLNMSSPGNPDGNAPNKFDYGSSKNIQILESGSDLWNSDSVVINMITDKDVGRLGESNHFAALEVIANQSSYHYFVGDMVYVASHAFVGYDVGIAAQCDWIAVLNYLSQRFDLKIKRKLFFEYFVKGFQLTSFQCFTLDMEKYLTRQSNQSMSFQHIFPFADKFLLLLAFKQMLQI